MIKKEIIIGALVGIVANTIGVYFATLLFGNGEAFLNSLQNALAEGFLGKLISLGAVLNLAAFFIFLKKQQDYRARGVLLATILIAVSTFLVSIQ